MDRLTNYFGQIPLETDLLRTNQNTMVAIAKLAAGVLGTPTTVNGFACTPTTPASLAVLLTPGEVYQLANLEATAWSSLPADVVHSIVKQGVLLDAAPLTITPPGTVGYSQVYLVEVQYQDVDAGSTVLPYYNAANPSSPFSGPGNAGTAQNTVRKGAVAVQIKAGVAAATGTQVAPAADAGWTGLFTVTVANGQATITSGNIAQLVSAPFIPVTLPALPSWVQGGSYAFGADTGTANAIVATLSPVPTSYTAGMCVFLKKSANASTGAVTINLNGIGAVALNDSTGSPLSPGALPANCTIAATFTGSSFNLIGGSTAYQSTSGFTANSGEGVSVVIPASTVTITIASPGVVTWNAHGLSNGTAVQFTTTGALPTGLAAGVTYYVVGATTNTFSVASTPGGTAINTSGTQSGTQTGNAIGAGTVNLNFNGLTNDSSPANNDIFARLKASSGHHVSMTYAQFLTALPTSLSNVQVFTSSGTYTPTSGAKNMLVFATGGGGAGGNGGSIGNGGGGSAGGTALYFGAVSSQVVTIGAGGAVNGSYGAFLVGGSGTTTSFGALAVATGGGGGIQGNNTIYGAGGQSVGAGTAGTLNMRGGGGSPAGVQSGGCGGSSFWGGGGFSGSKLQGTTGPGGAGYLGGGGGGGDGTVNVQGGAGGGGVVVIFEFQ